MTRDSAVDDYKAIRERMEQLAGKPAVQKPIQAENWSKMTIDELAEYVGKALECRSFHYPSHGHCGRANGHPGAINGAVQDCWAAGKCKTFNPCHP